jgi:hypothetical protein
MLISLYLDHVAGQWDGLLLNDYEAVMPFHGEKWGIPYILLPHATVR